MVALGLIEESGGDWTPGLAFIWPEQGDLLAFYSRSCQRRQRILLKWLEMRPGDEEQVAVRQVQEELDQVQTGSSPCGH